MTKQIIKNVGGKIIYECEAETFKEAIEEAVKKGVSLEYADLLKTNFTNANLTGSNFRSAFLYGAIFKNANLTNANFRSAFVDDANFENAILENIKHSNQKEILEALNKEKKNA